MESDENKEQKIRREIQKTLTNINDITLNIKTELNVINELIKENGELPTALDNANQALVRKVKEKGLSIKEIFKKVENDKMQSKLSSPITSQVLVEKLASHT